MLWHFHQPDYRDPQSGRPVLPWVRHHALRGYRDLPVAIVESGVAATVNFVPTLLTQLAWYAQGGSDDWLDRAAKPAEALGPAERLALLREGFSGHPAMVQAAPRWLALRDRVQSHGALDVQGLRDLQVWSILGWTGWSARRDFPVLQALIDQGANFTEADKRQLLQTQRAICAGLPEIWGQLPEVSASPWGHPILPLLVDARHGQRCLPNLPEVDFSWPQDAALQLVRGKAEVEGHLGRSITGLWPSEGAVSPEVLTLAEDAGFTWLVSDEGVLQRSDRQRFERQRMERQGSGSGPWRLGDGLVGFFRNRDLSDLVGFRTAGRDPQRSVDELLAGIRGCDGHVTLALDGENPWESHGDAGKGFLTCFFERLSRDPHLQTQTFQQASASPVGVVSRIHTGGWINADFAIWIGDEQDRVAWRLLAQARQAVAEAGDPSGALQHVLAAEGSDWFWWYGPEFHSDQDGIFDRLFRGHLAAAWQSLGQEVPRALQRSLLGGPSSLRDQAPIGPVEPKAALGWWGAGCWDARRPAGSMAQALQPLDRLLWGAGTDKIFLRLMPRQPLPPVDGLQIEVQFKGCEAHGQSSFEAKELLAGPVMVVLETPKQGAYRVDVMLRRGAQELGILGPPEGLHVDVKAEPNTWRNGWV
jgi:alpha-amylase/alpha-mannosidase (GH57 family)